ncbi:GIY-YIG nuclease family protein [Micromonospora sp. NPDC005174]|uniref:GIY-YIG nuclease family protein n=1 Tax=Micromonospora sp. NPDC005174 TaxID=3157018 RepID=UPI0033A3A07F
MTELTAEPPMLVLPDVPLDPANPLHQRLRKTFEFCALSLLLRGGNALMDEAGPNVRAHYFDGGRRTIFESMVKLRAGQVDVTPSSVASSLQGVDTDGDLDALLDQLSRNAQQSRGSDPDPLWMQLDLLMDFVVDLRREETALYFWYDAADVLLYIGITGDLATRQSSHAKKSSWSEFADHSKIRRFPSRPEAESAEKSAIEQHRPLFNHQHNDTPEARQRLVAYLIEHGRMDLLTPAVSRG